MSHGLSVSYTHVISIINMIQIDNMDVKKS